MMTDTNTNDVEQPKEAAAVVESGNDAEQPSGSDKLPAAGLLVSAIVLLVAVLSKGTPSKGDAYWAYGISLSVVAMFFALLSLSEIVDSNPKVCAIAVLFPAFLFELSRTYF